MKTIDWLVSQGRDPLEILYIPPASDVAEHLAQDAESKWDGWIKREFSTWPTEAIERLKVLIDKRARLARPAPEGE